jgi:hypothetical protein
MMCPKPSSMCLRILFETRFYVLRQDQNQVVVFDDTSMSQITALRTGNTPMQSMIKRPFESIVTYLKHRITTQPANPSDRGKHQLRR